MELVYSSLILGGLTIVAVLLFKHGLVAKKAMGVASATASDFDGILLKKNPEVDIHRTRLITLAVGAGISMFFAFKLVTWATPEEVLPPPPPPEASEMVTMDIPEIDFEEPEPEPEPEPPKPKVQKLTPTEDEVEEEDLMEEEIEDEIDFGEPEPEPEPEPETEPEPPMTVDFADVQAEFNGGVPALRQFLSSHINVDLVKATGARGMVVIQYEVNVDGRIQNVKVLKSLHPKVDQEVMRVFKTMPRWKPASLQGKPVIQRRKMPIPVGPRK